MPDRVQLDRYRFIGLRAPTLPADAVLVDGRELWRVWCKHCQQWHHHGPAAGHRVAHCKTGGYADTGYNLRPPAGW